MFSLSAIAQEQQISGKVTESGSGAPIPGVNVIVKGTSIGTITDMDGAFTLNASEGSILVFSFIGYTQREVAVTAGQTQFDISLDSDVTDLSEVIITGLASSISRSNLANSIESVKQKIWLVLQIKLPWMGLFTENLKELTLPQIRVLPEEECLLN